MEYLWDLLVNLHWGAVGQIIMIDILLGGDNAVVIAMACRNLPHEQRAKGIFWGTAGAIGLRVVLITFAVMLLDLPFLKVVGALLLLSFDNVIAIAGAAQQAHEAHQTLLVIFGLIVSVPFIVFGSQVVLKLLDRFPIIIYFGGGLLGWIAGGMIVSDGYVATHWPEFSFMAHYPFCIGGAAVVVIIGHLIARKKRAEHEAQLELRQVSPKAENAGEAKSE